jgi:hypothetical protein
VETQRRVLKCHTVPCARETETIITLHLLTRSYVCFARVRDTVPLHHLGLFSACCAGVYRRAESCRVPSPHPPDASARTPLRTAAPTMRDRDPHAADPIPAPLHRCAWCAPCTPCPCSPGAHTSALKSGSQNVDHHMQGRDTRNGTSRRTLYRHTPHAAVRANDERKKLNPGGGGLLEKVDLEKTGARLQKL